jgi:hypothetical protein
VPARPVSNLRRARRGPVRLVRTSTT